MKIVTVCGMGFGTSLMVKMAIDDLLNEIGFDAEVEASDVGSVKGMAPDLVVASAEMRDVLSEMESDVIYLNNMADKGEIRKKLLAYLKEKG
ncbi:MAG: PTS sugar transporter subunit IIB [Planifilum fimeticola]|jgi:PTS system ascorbate-specific IIB component